MKVKVDSLSILSLFMGTLALAVSIYQGNKFIEHNKLSVRPILNIGMSEDRGRYYLTIKNAGLGPAIINSVKIFHEEDQIIISLDSIGELFEDNISGKFKHLKIEKLSIEVIDIRGTSIESGTTIPIFKFYRKSENIDLLPQSFFKKSFL